MKLKLHTELIIDSAHKLENYIGNCNTLHGHSWKIEIWFKGDDADLDKIGILVDFGITKELKNKLDHKYLNDVLGYNPTAENLTKWIYNFIKNKINHNVIKLKVKVHECVVGKDTWCEGGDW